MTFISANIIIIIIVIVVIRLFHEPAQYALEGAIAIAGAGVSWLKVEG